MVSLRINVLLFILFECTYLIKCNKNKVYEKLTQFRPNEAIQTSQADFSSIVIKYNFDDSNCQTSETHGRLLQTNTAQNGDIDEATRKKLNFENKNKRDEIVEQLCRSVYQAVTKDDSNPPIVSERSGKIILKSTNPFLYEPTEEISGTVTDKKTQKQRKMTFQEYKKKLSKIEKNVIESGSDEPKHLTIEFQYLEELEIENIKISIPSGVIADLTQQSVIDLFDSNPCVEGGAPEPQFFTTGTVENVRTSNTKSAETFGLLSSVNIQETIHDLMCPKQVSAFPNDPLLPKLWHYMSQPDLHKAYLDNGKYFYSANVQDAHRLWIGNNTNYRIGVVDTGLDFEHPDMAEFDDSDLWSSSQFYFNSNENGGYPLADGSFGHCFNLFDDDGNGYDDDCFGVDFIFPFPAYDGDGHGTHVAGLISAATNNNKYIASGCPDCRVVPMKPMWLISSIAYAIRNNIRVLNWSFSMHKYTLHPLYRFILRAAIGLYKHRVEGVIIVSAGNDPLNLDTCYGDNDGDHSECDEDDYETGYPCVLSDRFDNVICVGASDQYGKQMTQSAYGSRFTTVFAPGNDIWSLEPSYFAFTNLVWPMDGTSPATAIVSSIVGLVRSRFPSLTAEQTRTVIIASCSETPFLKYKTECGGVVDAVKALAHGAVCAHDPDHCGDPLLPSDVEETHESILDWFCKKSFLFGHSFIVPFCN